MAQSTEYPDLRFIKPRSYTPDDRTKAGIKWIVIHTTQGSYHGQSAEDGALYNQKRTDGTSAHYFVDNNTVVQGVLTKDRAHTARRTGNLYGIQYELCGRAEWSEATWGNAYGTAMLRLAARQVARDVRKYDIPVRHLTVAQTKAKERGFVSHWDCTRAFPEDKGTHTDPGPNFPWSRFLDMVREELGQDTKEDEPLDAKDVELIIKTFRNTKEVLSDTNVGIIAAETANRIVPVLTRIEDVLERIEAKLPAAPTHPPTK